MKTTILSDTKNQIVVVTMLKDTYYTHMIASYTIGVIITLICMAIYEMI
jgi:hypothetical protein